MQPQQVYMPVPEYTSAEYGVPLQEFVVPNGMPQQVIQFNGVPQHVQFGTQIPMVQQVQFGTQIPIMEQQQPFVLIQQPPAPEESLRREMRPMYWFGGLLILGACIVVGYGVYNINAVLSVQETFPNLFDYNSILTLMIVLEIVLPATFCLGAGISGIIGAKLLSKVAITVFVVSLILAILCRISDFITVGNMMGWELFGWINYLALAIFIVVLGSCAVKGISLTKKFSTLEASPSVATV